MLERQSAVGRDLTYLRCGGWAWGWQATGDAATLRPQLAVGVGEDDVGVDVSVRLRLDARYPHLHPGTRLLPHLRDALPHRGGGGGGGEGLEESHGEGDESVRGRGEGEGEGEEGKALRSPTERGTRV